MRFPRAWPNNEPCRKNGIKFQTAAFAAITGVIAVSVSSANTTYTIMFSLFLKLLGFFVVLYSYADMDPQKSQAVETSLKERFNITLSPEFALPRSGQHAITPTAVQYLGRAYHAIESELQTQVDFLSSEFQARDNRMRLTLPADVILSFNGNTAKSPTFAHQLVRALRQHERSDLVYHVDIIARGEQADVLMRASGDFVQYMVAQDYAPRYLSIGFKEESDPPEVDIILTAVTR